jgi:hypothetical protein
MSSEAILNCLQAAESACRSRQGDLVLGCRPTYVSDCTWIQTPAVWGMNVNSTPGEIRTSVTAGTSFLLNELERILCSARKNIDISSLEHLPDGIFFNVLKRSLIYLDLKNRPISIRMLFGAHLATLETESTLFSFLSSLTCDLPDNSQLSIKVSRMLTNNSGVQSSWNHSKLVIVDDCFVLTGGHNLWSNDYLGLTPVHDLSALLSGGSVTEATFFLNQMWSWVESYKPLDASQFCHSFIYEGGCIHKVTSFFPPKPTSPPPILPSKANALALSRFGRGLGNEFDFADDQAKAAVFAAFRQTKSSILISHMDLAFRYNDYTEWPNILFTCLSDLLTASDRTIAIKIVLSQPNEKIYYSWNVKPHEIIAKLKNYIGERVVTGTASVSTIQYSQSGSYWPACDGIQTVANHSKTWIIDDHLFYIGSDNLYPHKLQEFGYLIDSPAFASDLIETYWSPLWRYSKQNMISL